MALKIYHHSEFLRSNITILPQGGSPNNVLKINVYNPMKEKGQSAAV